jgi:hypothetical protein
MGRAHAANGAEIFMSVLSSPTWSQRSTLGDLTAIWVVLLGALAYLDVPMRNAPLFAVALVLQAALGTFIITRLLDGLQPSLLLLCGPGLILGGAMSLAVFQIAGRGVVGMGATTGAGLVAAFMISQRVASNAEPPRMWILTQILGLAGLALVSEFSEMLPIAVAFFIMAYLLDPSRPKPVFLRVALISATACVIVFTFSIRQNYWWIVTDDYQYFEVISRHITQSGPTADWGVLSFLQYHWLSYGWSGLLNQLGGGTGPFVTLTQVMPFVYSASLAASLILISQKTHRRMPTFIGLLPVWVVIPLTVLDWSGTSTAGVYAALAALVCVSLFLGGGQRVQPRELLLLGVFVLIVTLTKMPSIFSILALLLGSLVVTAASQFSRAGPRVTTLVLGGIATLSNTLLLVWISGPYFGWRLDFTSVNYGLGQLSESGRVFSTIALIISRLLLWALAGPLVVRGRSMAGSIANRRLPESSLIATLLVLGLLLELGIFADANVFCYLAGPMYFLASIAIITHCDTEVARARDHAQNRVTSLSVVTILAFGLLWTRGGSERLWDVVDRHASFLTDLHISLLRFVSADSRVGATMAAVIITLALVGLRRAIPISQLLLLPVIVLTFSNSFWPSVRDFETEISAESTTGYLGTHESQAIAAQLKQVSRESDLIATNHLFDADGRALSNFSLAAWSGREFLILGPRFGGDVTRRKAEAIEHSMRFANSPSIDSCKRLESAGVKWFVVDLQLTDSRDWSACAETVVSKGRFTLLSMHYSRIDSP